MDKVIENMLVRVYKNLHKGCYSVQAKINGRWKVIKHVNSIYLEDVTFKVSQSGRNRVLKEKQKNVHAFVVGWYSYLYNNGADAAAPDLIEPKKVHYNPYQSNSFMVDDRPVKSAKACLINKVVLAVL